jgi:energy-coupling factor transporter ATP-binding protein EcfA2
MKKLEVNLENCYGIGKFKKVLDFEKSNTILIYAPNGTMKTSFAKTFEDISKNNNPTDRAYPNRKTTFNILSDDKEIEAISIFVINAEDSSFDATNKISSFIASADLKKEYDAIYSILDDSKNEFVKKLKITSQSSDCESEFISTFSENSKSSFFSSLLKIIDKIDKTQKKYDFRYNDIFDKKGNVKKFLDKNQKLIQQYFDNYQSLLSGSRFFKKSDNSFGTTQANWILDSIKDNAFFEAGHKFVLDGNIDINSAENLKLLVEEEINKIINDEKLKETFDKVDKAIGANVEIRAFKSAIEKDNLILVELQNYDDFRKNVWLGYFHELKDEAKKLIELYKTKKDELEKIIKEAKKEVDIWKNIIAEFNSRFYVPFKVILINQEDIILKLETATLEFEYKDKETEASIKQNKDALLRILSKGEQRAYYILQLLFDIEARKINNLENLLILDDIADSFDYKNKYAIIEYIKDIHESNIFKSIILTHNFDFYRTIASRLDLLRSSVFMTLKDENREIELIEGQYKKDVFSYFMNRLSDPKIFISLIPFVRNIVDYSDGSDCTNYKILTSCLHKKDDSNSITGDKILIIFKEKLNKCNDKTIKFKDEKIIDLIFNTAQDIIDEQNIDEILLENKIVLSIAIRLKAEIFMINSLNSLDLSSISINQTRALFNEYKKNGFDIDKVRTLDKVNLMTPENIHMNAFMYEPLIDMSVKHLLNLYNDVINLE